MMATYDEILVEIKEGRKEMIGGYKALKEDLSALEAQLAEIKGMLKDQSCEEQCEDCKGTDGLSDYLGQYNEWKIEHLSQHNRELIEKNRKLKKKIKKLKRKLAGDFA